LLKKYAKQLSNPIPSKIVAECTTIQTKNDVSVSLTLLRNLSDKLRQYAIAQDELMVNTNLVTEELKRFDVCPLCKNKLGNNHGIHAH